MDSTAATAHRGPQELRELREPPDQEAKPVPQERLVPRGKGARKRRTGAEGSPWTAGGTLPSGKTETGTWGFGLGGTAHAVYVPAPISFTVPLSKGLDAEHVHYVGASETAPEACQGSVEEPTATKGNLCVYERATLGELEEPPIVVPPGQLFVGPAGAGTTGAIVFLLPKGELGADGWGSWAVTAP